MTEIISIENLSVGYDKTVAVENINFSALKGQIVGIIGLNGSGKTAFLRTLSKELTPINGTIFIGEENSADITKLSKGKLSKVVYSLFNENISSSTKISSYISKGNSSQPDECEKMLELFNLTHLKDQKLSKLSSGELQSANIIKALLQNPDILILDNPTNNLDIKSKLALFSSVKNIAKEKNIIVLISLNEIDLALKYCENIMVINENKVIDFGIPEEIIYSDYIDKTFDLTLGSFNEFTASTEFKGKDGNDLFIFAGGGTGSDVFRFFQKHGFALTSGVLYENDIDCYVGKTICSKVITELPFEELKFENVIKARKLAEEAKIIIDTGCPIAVANNKMVFLLRDLAQKSRPIFSLRDETEWEILFGDKNIVFCKGLTDMLNKVNEYLAENKKDVTEQ